MMKSYAFLFALIIFFSSCRMKKHADHIFHNGVVYTVDSAFTIAQAFVVDKGKIVDVGSDKDILAAWESDSLTDLKEAPVYPGLIDAHCHFYGYGQSLMRADLVGTESFEEVIAKTKEYANSELGKTSEWVLGRGWDQNDWPVKEFPSNEKLDEAFPDRPVFLTRVDGHAALANSEALRRAGVTASSKIDGGEILLKNGKLTGLLIDNAMDLVREAMPSSSAEQNRQALLKAQENCFAMGITTVDDAGLGKSIIGLIDSLQKEGSLKMRMYVMLSDNDNTLEYYLPKGIYKTDRLNIRSIKAYADGALGSRGARLLAPYADKPDHTGLLMNNLSHYDSLAEQAVKNGYQLNIHAIGDSGVRMVLQVYARHLPQGNDLRWRVEHAQVVHPDDLQLFEAYRVIPSVQPTHATSDMYWAGDRLGPVRVKTAYAYRDLMKAYGMLALGTDFPVESINQMYTFYAAVERKDLKGYPDGGFQPENKISREDALRGMTIWAAYSNFEEGEKGSIEKGKLADFVILDADIMKIEGNQLPKVKVKSTYLGGEKVYSE